MPANPDRPATRGAGHSSSRVAPYPRPEDRPARRATGDAGDSGSESGAAGSSSGPRTTRQQYSACGACRMRRVKCNLKDVVVDLASGGRPACSNCQERSLNCIDEYDKTVKIGKQKLLRRGRRIQGAEAIFGKVNDIDALDQASSIPDLAPEFFQTAFFHRLQVQHPVIEPSEFIGRYQAYMNGESQTLGADGLLVAKVFVLWAAAFGLDEAGREIHDAESPLALTPPNDPLAAKRDGWGNRLTGMIRELLRLIDVHSIMRKPTWDGVRVLLLFLPLLVQASDCEDAERQVMQETAYSHIYALCSRGLSKLAADGDQYTDALVRARVFWCAYVREGTTTGLRGGRLVITDEDLESFQSTLPRPQPHTPPVSQAQANFQQARHFAQITIEISVACRLVHAALTGPRARQRMGEAHVDETILTRGWDMLDTCWHKLDSLRTQYGHIHAQTEEVDLFASGWQLFIFEAHNIIREALKQRMLALGEAPYIHLPNNNSLHTHVKGLHERALRHCNVVLRMVMDIVKSHIDLAQSSPFFAYDVALIRDACFFAPILLATIDSNLYASEDELRRDIDLCIHATRSMRFAYRRCSDRERSIETLWDLRRHRLHNTRAQGRPPPLALTASNFLPPSSTPPALSMPHLFYAPNSAGWDTTQQQMTIALHPADQRSARSEYASVPITPTNPAFGPSASAAYSVHHASTSAPAYASYSNSSGSSNSRPSTSGEGQSSVTAVTDPSRGMPFPGASVEATTPLDANFAFAYAPASFNGESLQPPLAPNMTFPSESHSSLDMSGNVAHAYPDIPSNQSTSLAFNDWGYSPLS